MSELSLLEDALEQLDQLFLLVIVVRLDDLGPDSLHFVFGCEVTSHTLDLEGDSACFHTLGRLVAVRFSPSF